MVDRKVIILTTGFGLGLLGVGVLYFWATRKSKRKDLKYNDRMLRKQRERLESFEQLRQKYEMSEDYQKIIRLSAEELSQNLQDRTLSATEVLNAFLAKSLEATGKFNCITEFVPNAIELAMELDKLKEVKGPLHGLPICIKDDTNIAGMDSTLGFAKNLYFPAADSAVLVKVLKDLGAIPFCKTNIPQSLLSHGSENPIFGCTLNCINKELNPGGSSSGSGCLVGAGGAVFGTGTDIGGSGRIPAHFNGICSIKPTPHRISGKGIVQAVPKAVGLVAVPSIFAKRAKTLTTAFKRITGENRQNVYDPLSLPIPWRTEIFESTRKLRIGYYSSLNAFPTIGDTKEIVMNAKLALESLGHVLIPFSLPDSFDLSLFEDLLCADKGEGLLNAFSGEIIAETLKPLYEILLSMKRSWKHELWALLRFQNNPQSDHVWNTMFKKKCMIDVTLNTMLEQELDLILCPAFPYPALRLCDPFLHEAVCYTFIWNILDFPAGIVPFGIESGENIANYDDKGIKYLRYVKQVIHHSIGMPIAVQIVGKPFMEEQVLRVLTELDEFADTKF